MEELCDKLEMLHKIEGNHTGRTKLYKRVSQEYHGVTEMICGLFVKTCQVCHLKKSKISPKGLVVKPITSTNFLSRAQVDSIDIRDKNPEANMSRME